LTNLIFAKLSKLRKPKEETKMHLSKKVITAIIAVSFLLLALPTATLLAGAQPTTSNPRLQPSVPLPAGVTANITVDTIPNLSFRPNPIGIGQTLLVNLWFNPPTHYNRILTGITVDITKPDGTKDTKSGIVTYGGDATAWFEYTPDQVGTWKLKMSFPGGYFPAGNIAGGYAEPAFRWLDSAYYKPAQTDWQTLTVQANPILSYPPSPLPTDYWTRPVNVVNREWHTILGSYPYTGTMPNPPANTNPYASNYRYTPYVTAPNTAHIAWMRQGALSGMLGSDFGQYSVTSGGGTPSVIYMGRCYQTVTKASTSGTNSQSYWQCYDLRTGQVYWEIPLASGQSAPTNIHYDQGIGEVPGAEAAVGTSAYLVSITSASGSNPGRIIYYSPYTGTVSFNVTGPPSGVSAGTLYADPYVYSVQTIGTQYRLIKWTIERSTSTVEVNGVTYGAQVTDNFTARIISNITWPFSSLGTCDFQAGIAATLSSSLYPNLGAFYGTRIQAADLNTGNLLFNITDPDTCESSSELVVDHGKLACAMQGYHWNCYDRTGKKVWTSELTGYPWGDWWAYSVASFAGNIIGSSYDAIYAFNWDTGKIAWRFEAPTNPYESPYVDPNGTSVSPFFTAVNIADGKVFAYNSEHTPSQPYVRGWKIFAINATDGTGIWNITGSMSPGPMADGYLTASNSYDGYMYVFGKGKSATIINAPDVSVPLGTPFTIKGTVTDQSPGQPDTPCVSRDSMTTQMEYLHMQLPIDGIWHNISMTGVDVLLTAIEASGAVTSIGATTTNPYYGTFSYEWTPAKEGKYTITATFAGDDSYGSSGAATSVSVGPAPTTPTSTQPTVVAQTDYTLAIVASAIAVIIAVAIATVIILRKK
jgi:hypothetical protein